MVGVYVRYISVYVCVGIYITHSLILTPLYALTLAHIYIYEHTHICTLGGGALKKPRLTPATAAVIRNDYFYHQGSLLNYYLITTYSKPFLPTQYATLERIVTYVSNLLSGDGTRSASVLFLSKPDKKLYPDYYELIPEPISLKEVLGNVKKGSYKCLVEMEYDMALMALNARLYNGELSYVFTGTYLCVYVYMCIYGHTC